LCRGLDGGFSSASFTAQLFAMSQQNMISAQKVEELIAQGEPVVVHEGYALNISQWIDNHPGGRLAILHMVGRDATDEINMYARPSYLGS
jgi:cytochrome b involved in lipid metabolism